MFDRIKRVVADFLSGPDTSRNKTPVVIGPEKHHINAKLVPHSARRTCELLQERGFKAYVVGGAVRDLLIGVKPKDFDVATNATPEQVKKIQRRAYIIGRRFRLVHVVFGEEIIECSTFRALDAEGVRKDRDGRVISDNVFGEMWEDAARRDFTVNALYYDPVTEEVFDYHHGFEDIQKKRIRMIGDPEERYREDPVRMMRAVRISAKLGFTMESATERAIPKMASLLENVPAARLFDEMMKLFTSGHAEQCLVSLRKEKLHRSLLPMLDVILSEPEGEKFLLLALHRTDERIAAGKKISPAFMFCTLLWPQVVKRWKAYEAKQNMPRANALFAAADDVISTQCCRLAIQNRFIADMKMIWMMQLRFERRTGKNPYTLVTHPKYRASYDFMLLRSLLGHVPSELVTWWETFAASDFKVRRDMVEAAQIEARRTGDAAREGRRKKAEVDEAEAAEAIVSDVAAAESERQSRRGRRRRLREEEKNAEAAAARFEVEQAEERPVIETAVALETEPKTPIQIPVAPQSEVPVEKETVTVEPDAPVELNRNEHVVSTATGDTLVQVETLKPVVEPEKVVPEVTEVKTVKRVRRRKAATAEPVVETAQTNGTGEASSGAVVTEEAAKPKRRRTVKKIEKKVEDASAGEVAAETQAAVKPRRTRRTKKTEEASTVTAVEAAADPEKAGEDQEKVVEKPKRVRRTKKTVTTEAAERIALDTTEGAQAEVPAKPKGRRTTKKVTEEAGAEVEKTPKKRPSRRKTATVEDEASA